MSMESCWLIRLGSFSRYLILITVGSWTSSSGVMPYQNVRSGYISNRSWKLELFRETARFARSVTRIASSSCRSIACLRFRNPWRICLGIGLGSALARHIVSYPGVQRIECVADVIRDRIHLEARHRLGKLGLSFL